MEGNAPRHDRAAQPGAVHIQGARWLHHGLLGSKVFDCPTCGAVIDRNVNGNRNILLRAVAGVDGSAVALVVKEASPVFVPGRTTSSPLEGA